VTEETRKAIFRSVTVYRKKDIYTVSVVTMSMVAISDSNATSKK
jgi:hypothetical protein